MSALCVCVCVCVCVFVCDKQEKRKIPAVPNGELAESKEHGGHGGPELQHTGRWVWTVCVCVSV